MVKNRQTELIFQIETGPFKVWGDLPNESKLFDQYYVKLRGG